MKRLIAAVLLVSATSPAQPPADGEGPPGPARARSKAPARITPVYSRSLPGVPGKSLKGVLVEYAPGGASPPHRHARSAMIYATVLEGSVLCRLNGGPVRTYRQGENWTESPGDRHQVSANASRTKPARILAIFVVDDADAELTLPDPD
jgi:quercetin dioxygenase-like cupin family protein